MTMMHSYLVCIDTEYSQDASMTVAIDSYHHETLALAREHLDRKLSKGYYDDVISAYKASHCQSKCFVFLAHPDPDPEQYHYV